MATTNPMVDTSTASENPNGSLLVLLPSSPQAQLETILTHLTASLPAEDLLIASPEAPPDSHLNLRFVDLPASKPSWTLTAGETFWPTLAVCAAASIAVALPFLGLWQLRSTVNAWCWLIVNVALTYATATLAGGFALPFTARWMLVCEERHAR